MSSSNFPVFPQSAYFGVGAKFAELYAEHYESSKEYLYVDFLTALGVILSRRYRADFGELNTQPRLYTLKIATSAWRRKSQSTTFAHNFVANAVYRAQKRVAGHIVNMISKPPSNWFRFVPGAGSAEGLGNSFAHWVPDPKNKGEEILVGDRRILLVYDEFRRFEKKANGEGSVLLEMVNELFEKNVYGNTTKMGSVNVNDGHLGFASNTTEDAFRELVNATEMTGIGFLNRFFLVGSDKRIRRAFVTKPTEQELNPLLDELAELLAALPPLDQYQVATGEVVVGFTPEARQMWEDWYNTLEELDTTARLDTIGMRLMALFTFLARKPQVDTDIMRAVLDVLDYQWKLRELYRPLKGVTPTARMEEKVTLQLKQRGPLTENELRRHTNADRDGLRVFDFAMQNLRSAHIIKPDAKMVGKKLITKFVLIDEEENSKTAA